MKFTIVTHKPHNTTLLGIEGRKRMEELTHALNVELINFPINIFPHVQLIHYANSIDCNIAYINGYAYLVVE